MSAIKIRISAVSRLLIFRFKMYQHLFWQLLKCNLIHFFYRLTLVPFIVIIATGYLDFFFPENNSTFVLLTQKGQHHLQRPP